MKGAVQSKMYIQCVGDAIKFMLLSMFIYGPGNCYNCNILKHVKVFEGKIKHTHIGVLCRCVLCRNRSICNKNHSIEKI